MNKIFLEINKVIYSYDKSENKIYKVVEPKECYNKPCYIINSLNSHKSEIYTNIFEDTLPDKKIKHEISKYMDNFLYSKINTENKTFVFGVDKEYFLDLIDKYRFSSVYPLEFLLYKMGNGYNGIISDIIIFAKKYSSSEDYKTIGFMNEAETFYYPNVNPEIFKDNIDIIVSDNESNIAFIGKSFSEYDNSHIDFIDFLLKTSKKYNLYIEDNISSVYRKNKINKFLYIADAVLLLFGLYFIVMYFNIMSNNDVYSSMLENQTNEINKLKKLDSEIKRKIPKIYFNQLKYNNITNKLKKFTDFDPYSYKVTITNKSTLINIEIDIEGIDEVEKMLSILKYNKYQYSYIKKRGYIFSFKIAIKV